MDSLALNTKDQHLESYDLSHLPIKVQWGELTGTKWEAQQQQQQQQRVQGSSFSYLFQPARWFNGTSASGHA